MGAHPKVYVSDNPHLAAEWHPCKNGDLTASAVAAGSDRRAWWRCSYGHEWRASCNNRSRGTGCPYCSGRLATVSSCLDTTSPTLAAEWHLVKNGELTPKMVTAGSHKKVWWHCAAGHEWDATVKNRANGYGCPYCSGRRPTDKTSLAAVNPQLATEWLGTKNLPAQTPSTVTSSSHKKVWWVCARGHEWRASVNNRAKGSRCPCCAAPTVSKASQEWLDSLGIPEEFREYPIKLPGRKRAIKVDGFDPKTNTVYEFLGDFWHGNPDLYDSEDVNPVNRKTFGGLFSKTQRRLSELREAGHIVVFIWENDFKECIDGKA